ncbi:hypothetical protein P7D93_19040 [Enterococcus raffinosus]|uniref:hypothetical protein n=1 Tax=Enterococcus raffinosus TaxID=71452 RepID=UPI00289214AE|nr:hypothetical protein [Enterococcus raffinosus]MDT2531959.1 hypothetical protein [Enterococcus raffinosus]
MKLINDYQFSFNELVGNCNNPRINNIYKLKFCRFAFDIAKLYQTEDKFFKSYIEYKVKDEDGNYLKEIFTRTYKDRNGEEKTETREYIIIEREYKTLKEIDYYYSILKYRAYYYLLFSFIYSNFTLDDIKELGELIEENAENEGLTELNENFGDDKEFPLWSRVYISVAGITGYYMAVKEYQNFVLNKRMSVKKYLDAELVEKQCNILKEDVEKKGYRYLTYKNNLGIKIDPKTKKKKKISHSKRLRNVQKNNLGLYEFQKEQQEQRDQMLIEIMQEYYDLKRKNKKLTIDDFLQNHKISKRTFFNYKKIYDQKYLGKRKIEKAYQAFLDELEKDSNFKISSEFVSKYKVSQTQLKRYINDINAEG